MYSESLSAVTEPTGHRSGFFPLGVVFIYYFFICIVDRGKKIYIYIRVLMIRGMRMLIWRSHHYGSTIWPQEGSRFWSFDYLNAHKLRKKKERQNKMGKKLVDVSMTSHQSYPIIPRRATPHMWLPDVQGWFILVPLSVLEYI